MGETPGGNPPGVLLECHFDVKTDLDNIKYLVYFRQLPSTAEAADAFGCHLFLPSFA
jgi:hypothetical protein